MRKQLDVFNPFGALGYAVKVVVDAFGEWDPDQPQVKAMLQRLRGLIAQLVGGGSVSETDFQQLALSLLEDTAPAIGQSAMKRSPTCEVAPQTASACLATAAFATVQQCYAQLPCTPDEIAREVEIHLTMLGCAAGHERSLALVAAALADVLHPPRDATPSRTAKRSVEAIVGFLSILADDEERRAPLRAVEKLTLALVDRDLASAVVSVMGSIAEQVEAGCPDNGGTGCAMLPGDRGKGETTRATRTLIALMGYAGSYRKDESATESGRREERRIAMEALVESLASNKSSRWAITVAPGFGAGPSLSYRQGNASGSRGISGDWGRSVGLSAPVGVSYRRHWGDHTGWAAQFHLLDLGNYATESTDAAAEETGTADSSSAARLRIQSAVSLGGGVGLLLGTRSLKVLTSVGVSYSPYLIFEGSDEKTRQLRGTVSIAVPVEFVTF